MDDNYFYMFLLVEFLNFKNKITVENHCGGELNDDEIIERENMPNRLKDFHLKNNGFGITWQAKKIKDLFGGFKFIPIEEIFQNYRNELYFEEDLEEDPLLENFRPFDEISPEVRCGFIDHPTEKIASIFILNQSNLNGLEDLDIDFDGYIELMKMCWAYNNWPYILLYIQGEELKNLYPYDRPYKTLVDNFINNMPKIFPSFNWQEFVEKYNSLRLSKR